MTPYHGPIDPESWHLQNIKMEDIESAYRNIAIHLLDHHLLGLKWRNAYYIDLALPFGLRSAPAIFNSGCGIGRMEFWSITTALRTCCII